MKLKLSEIEEKRIYVEMRERSGRVGVQIEYAHFCCVVLRVRSDQIL